MMRPRIVGFLVMTLVGAGAGVIAAVVLLRGGDAGSTILLSNFEVRTADAQAAPAMSAGSAETIARTAAASKMTETIVNTARLRGNPIEAVDLVEKDGGFAPAALEVKSHVSNFRYTSSEATDLWVFIYEVKGVEMPDWNITDGVVEVDAVINDKTGGTESVSVLRYNPNAK
ncbi:MAG TPA: hypothetical protein VLS25_11080 [Dehalococcoidia bacterium]|nr:hypothetical protein [Dehalococcoidia bacterium]